jgi:hypothetical protein
MIFTWHYNFYSVGMMKELCDTIFSKPFTQGFVNCWLSYTLSQPVEIDITILLYFVMQYVGIMKLTDLLEKGRSCFQPFSDEENEESIQEEQLVSQPVKSYS